MKRHIYFATVLISALTVIFLSVSCNNRDTVAPARNLQDSIPPHFENLVFPDDGSSLPEGSLLITGVLVDTAEEGESGFDQDCPVYLEIETLGYAVSTQGPENSVLRTTKFHVYNTNSDPIDPTFFDFDTGNFAIDFGSYRVIKPGNYNLRLVGVDAVGNESDPMESLVVSLPVTGIDPQDVYDARSAYGVRLVDLFESYSTSLANYGNLYEFDIDVINEFESFIESTYINNPHLDAWYDEACTLYDNIAAIPYPDPIIHSTLLTGLGQFKEQIPGMVELKAAPFYPIGASQSEIINYHNENLKNYSSDIFSIENPYQGNPYATHYYFLAYNLFLKQEMTEIADFAVIADPNQSLQATGSIGSPASWYDIEPGDYDNPIELLGLFAGTGLGFHFFKIW